MEGVAVRGHSTLLHSVPLFQNGKCLSVFACAHVHLHYHPRFVTHSQCPLSFLHLDLSCSLDELFLICVILCSHVLMSVSAFLSCAVPPSLSLSLSLSPPSRSLYISALHCLLCAELLEELCIKKSALPNGPFDAPRIHKNMRRITASEGPI